MFLLDTDILSAVMRRNPPATLVAKLASVPPARQFTSSITLGELVYGARRLGKQGSHILQRLDDALPRELRVLPFDAPAAGHYGELRALLERQGMPLGDADLRIAAIALDRHLTVVTGNVRHFERVPSLVVENWLSLSV